MHRKITIEFSSDIDSEIDEALICYQKSSDYRRALQDFSLWIRNQCKYQEGESVSKEALREEFHNVLQAYNIELC